MTLLKPYPFLSPLAYLYGGVSFLRQKAYERKILPSYQSNLPVICVGNIAAGGSGKSSFAAYLARGFVARGFKPVILSRGYQGRYQGAHLVTEADSVFDVGDEAKMNFTALAPGVSIVVSRDRVLGAKLIEQQKLGNIIILDDGYQHFRLSREVNLLMVDLSSPRAINNWANGKLLPAGYLRETKRRGLSRATAVLFFNKERPLTKADRQTLDLEQGVGRSYLIGYGSATLVDLYSGERVPVSILAGQNVTVMTALADPSSFINSVKTFGANVINQQIFPDHYYYIGPDWTRARVQKPVIVTSKDAVKLKNFIDDRACCYVLERNIVFFEDNEEQDFWAILMKNTAQNNQL